MDLNTNKTIEMLITFSKNPTALPPIVINGESIHRVDITKLLVVTISSDLTWGTHVEYIYSQAAIRLNSLRMLCRANLPPEYMFSYNFRKIQPVLEYACKVWNPSLTQKGLGTTRNHSKVCLKNHLHE